MESFIRLFRQLPNKFGGVLLILYIVFIGKVYISFLFRRKVIFSHEFLQQFPQFLLTEHPVAYFRQGTDLLATKRSTFWREVGFLIPLQYAICIAYIRDPPHFLHITAV